ncbi:MAG TPA: zf-HC2 domain-containing protein [Anaeromyxobacteraceae bacterium]|jgi:anti-sigma factor RsiW
MRHVASDLVALLDGALADEERARVEAHLAGCGPCRAQRDRIAAAIGFLASLPPPADPAPGLEERFQARLAREADRPRGLLSRVPWRIAAPLAAAGAVAAAVAVAVVRERRAEAFAAEHLELFERYELVASIGDVADEDAEVVAHLDELEGRR